mgnify:FL=1
MTNLKITPLESEVIEWLLRGDESVLAALRKQYSVASVLSRELTGKGFYLKFDIPSNAQRFLDALDAKPSFYLGDVEAQIDPLKGGAGFVLWITDGKLDILEGYTFGEEWPTQITKFELRYLGGNRDWKALRQQWEIAR